MARSLFWSWLFSSCIDTTIPLREQVLVGNLGNLTEALAAEERRRLLEEQSQRDGEGAP